ncbi:MAG: outer membrane protein assembly factor BamB [Verrucomicrobiota bacterium]|jgi:outer membrane protein assembly factor BamB
MNFQNLAATVAMALPAAFSAFASDWPQLLGPTRDAVYSGPALAEKWPLAGPPIVWKVAVGEGYSCPIVGEGKLILCHRIADELLVDCRDPATGATIWTFKHAMKFQDGAFFDNGPRPTPAIYAGRLYVHNADGYLACLDLKDGKKIWSRHPKSEFHSGATWHGCVASPYVNDRAVILPVGGTNGGGIVAFARDTGETLWQVTDDKASAATPVPAVFDGKPQLLVVTRTTLHSLNPDTGADYWSIPTRRQTSGDVYAASPVVSGDQIFLSGWYKLGAQFIRVKNNQPEKVWHLDDAISTHYAAGIIHEGYLYGFHGHAWERGGPNLRCVELATGKMVWEQPQVGSGTLVRFKDNLLILIDTGELQLAKASPKGFKTEGRVQVVGRTTRSYPAIADGFAYIKGPRQLVCVDLRAEKKL